MNLLPYVLLEVSRGVATSSTYSGNRTEKILAFGNATLKQSQKIGIAKRTT